MVGTDRQDIDAFRKGSATEPILRMGPGINDATLAWLRKALSTQA
jgi:hypothetical protein